MIQAGLEDCKAELKADLELKLESEGKKGVVVGQWKEVLRSMAATVIRADPSCVVVKMENGEVKPGTKPAQHLIYHPLAIQVGLQILEEETMMTKEPRDWATIDSSITIGDKVSSCSPEHSVNHCGRNR